MALPELTLPPSIPRLLVEGHAIDEASVFADVPRPRGHMRKRRVYTVGERIVDVAWRLTQAQMTALDDWAENALQSLDRFFSIQVADQASSGLLWWQAKWVEPYKAEPRSGFLWNVTGKLLLIGEGSATPPPSTSLALEISVPLTGSAALTVGKALALEIVVALQQPLTLGAVGFGAELLATTLLFGRITESDIGRDTEDDLPRLTEDA